MSTDHLPCTRCNGGIRIHGQRLCRSCHAARMREYRRRLRMRGTSEWKQLSPWTKARHADAKRKRRKNRRRLRQP